MDRMPLKNFANATVSSASRSWRLSIPSKVVANHHLAVPGRQVRAFGQAAAAEPFYGSPRPLPKPSARGDGDYSRITAPCDRIGLLLKNAATAMKDPTRADAVAAVGELTGPIALQKMLVAMQEHPVGREILRDRPVVSKNTIPYEQLLSSSKTIGAAGSNATTFGQGYGAFLRRHGFDPDERDEVKYLDKDSDLAYVMLRYRQCHDFFHTLTDLPPTVPGELGLKWLELFQTGLPLAALASTVGTLRLNYQEQKVVWGIYLPWAQRVAQQMPFCQLMNVYYEKEWDTPLHELRARLKVEPAPQGVEEAATAGS